MDMRAYLKPDECYRYRGNLRYHHKRLYLELDAINELRKEGVPLMEAIHEAGRRRLRPIIMTSLTTIFGMVPLLFTFDMGSELQKPLSIAMISAMLIGTAVSLFIIPLVYWFIYRRHAL